jgi:hypothetical protein
MAAQASPQSESANTFDIPVRSIVTNWSTNGTSRRPISLPFPLAIPVGWRVQHERLEVAAMVYDVPGIVKANARYERTRK